jgi:hypothetical protein|tara:strand:- start:82 stop:654 length:573 start_codon:yes stop_codon:yes gene_type:complete
MDIENKKFEDLMTAGKFKEAALSEPTLMEILSGGMLGAGIIKKVISKLGPIKVIDNNLTQGPVRVRDVGKIKDIDVSFAPLIAKLNEKAFRTSFSHSALKADHLGDINPSVPHIAFESKYLTGNQTKAIRTSAKELGLEVRKADTSPPSLFVEGNTDDLLGGIAPDGRILDTFEAFVFNTIKKFEELAKK